LPLAKETDRLPSSIEATHPDIVANLTSGQLGGSTSVERLLHQRLRFIGLTFSLCLLYFAVLSVLNPADKVGLFLESGWLKWLNATVLLAFIGISAFLFAFRKIDLSVLRVLEVALFGLMLVELGCGLASDLFIDHELVAPIRAGDHALFHYSSSWSLPFFALIVGYGTLVPSSWKRCTVIVCAIAMVPILVSLSAVMLLHGIDIPFLRSFLLQMVLWMATAAAIAIYGVRRLEQVRRQVLRSGKLGRYRLIKQIASGGMGEIYLAEHQILNMRCAIKLMHPKWSRDTQLFARFEREVQVLAGLSHPNSVQIYDFGYTDDGVFYYVMEYLDGSDLERVVRSHGAMPVPQVLDILLPVAEALQALHRSGLVHRDVKPGNIFCCHSGVPHRIKLLDFGLVKPIFPDETVIQQLTIDGSIVGTPAFMSPEQARGYELDARSDIYSLGAVAYYLLAGKLPFDGLSVVETLTAQIQDAPVSIQSMNPEVDDEFAEVIHRCMAKDPACRFPDMAQLIDSLNRLQAPNPDRQKIL
jgi:serine/threonine-protein kinase